MKIKTMTIPPLPTNPKGFDLEDYIAAFLPCNGYYVEKSLNENSGTDVLELDIMAWRPSIDPQEHKLFEVKGGRWGFSDIFKLLGWKTYLAPRKVHSAAFVGLKRDKSSKQITFMAQKCREIGLTLVVFEDSSALDCELRNSGVTSITPNPLDHSTWRYSYWLDRQMQLVARENSKSNQDTKGPEEIKKYYTLLRNGFVQAQNVQERVMELYQAHFEHRRLAMSVAAELDGDGWEPEDPSPGKHWGEAMRKGTHPLIQAAMYYQHKARLDILKGVVEVALLEQRGVCSANESIDYAGGMCLPGSFRKTVRELQDIDRFEMIPVLWQSFLWKWGGFFVADDEKDEMAQLACEVGMSLEAVEHALSLYNTLFPIPGNNEWYCEFQGTKVIKYFPSQFRGLGVEFRCQSLDASNPSAVYGVGRGYCDQHLVTNLSSWHASMASLLNWGSPKATGKSSTS